MSIQICPSDEFVEQEEEDSVSELEYAGIKASWLREEIIRRSKCALLKANIKYKSAVKIQSNLRGWKVRQTILHYHRSATKIQKTWRGFLGRIRYFHILETTLQSRMVEHYNKSATQIQAAFHGFYSRKYTHDHYRLKKLQLLAARELLQCVAIKARDLIKNQQLPGVYSLRNSKCLSKVEKLMASLQIKNYNEEVRNSRTAEINKLTKAFEKSIQNTSVVEVPFGSCGKGDERRKLSQK